jgi:hypothetical protein
VLICASPEGNAGQRLTRSLANNANDPSCRCWSSASGSTESLRPLGVAETTCESLRPLGVARVFWVSRYFPLIAEKTNQRNRAIGYGLG